MKFGFRTPNIKKSIKARTTGRIKKSIKKSLNPIYGKSRVGFIKNPGKSVKNSLYYRTTIDTTKTINTYVEKNNANTTKSVSKITNGEKEVSVAKVGLALYTGGLSLLLTGIHKKNKHYEKPKKASDVKDFSKYKGFL